MRRSEEPFLRCYFEVVGCEVGPEPASQIRAIPGPTSFVTPGHVGPVVSVTLSWRGADGGFPYGDEL